MEEAQGPKIINIYKKKTLEKSHQTLSAHLGQYMETHPNSMFASRGQGFAETTSLCRKKRMSL